MGQNVYGANRPRGEFSMELSVHGAKCHGANFHGASFHGVRFL
jgi:hypothetical protein